MLEKHYMTGEEQVTLQTALVAFSAKLSNVSDVHADEFRAPSPASATFSLAGRTWKATGTKHRSEDVDGGMQET